jgi:hypothetical protein
MDPAGELAQLGQALLELLDRGVEQLRRLCVGLRRRAGEPERQRERDEMLLGAVVEVALDPAARRVPRGDQPGA